MSVHKGNYVFTDLHIHNSDIQLTVGLHTPGFHTGFFFFVRGGKVSKCLPLPPPHPTPTPKKVIYQRPLRLYFRPVLIEKLVPTDLWLKIHIHLIGSGCRLPILSS